MKKKHDDTITITITLRGNPAGVVNALANGIPREGLEGIRDGMIAELEKRERRGPRKGTRRVSIKVKGRA